MNREEEEEIDEKMKIIGYFNTTDQIRDFLKIFL